MAVFQNTTLASLNVTGDFEAQGGMVLSTKDYLTVQVSNLSGIYSTTGPLTFESVIAGSGGTITANGALSRFTVSKAGYYHAMYFNIGNASTVLGVESRAEIRKNGGSGVQARGDRNHVYPMVTAFRVYYMDVGDYFELHVLDGEHYFAGPTGEYTNLSMHRLYH